MKKVIISRQYDKSQTFGQLYVMDGDYLIFDCDTLELPYLDNKKNISCIPEGKYDLTKIIRPDGREGLAVDPVPGRHSILIHSGNYASGNDPDIQGCILVGAGFRDINFDGHLDIINSSATFDKLYAVLDKENKLYII